jgi:uncharacterized membrane protein
VSDRPDPSAESARAGMTGSGRVEAFSDGVFAIAITLLILDVAVPPRDSTPSGGLAEALGHQWPSYFAYLVSFHYCFDQLTAARPAAPPPGD